MNRITCIITILILINTILYTGCIDDNKPVKPTRSDGNPYDLESSPLFEDIEEFLEDNPGYRHRHIGWCGTPMITASGEFMKNIRSASAEDIIPLLNHTAPYLRSAVHGQLTEMGNKAMRAITDAYENGSARIKLELMKYIDPEASDEKLFSLLDEVIHDDKLPVFFEDLNLLRLGGRNYYQEPMTLDDYPFDIYTYYMRLMTESDFMTDRGIAAMSLGGFGEEATDAVPALIELLEGDDEYIQTWWGFGAPGVSSESLRGAAAIALGDIGPNASDAFPALFTALEDPNVEVRCCAASSLYLHNHINKNEMVELLIDLLNDNSNDYYFHIITCHIERIAPDASPALPRLRELTGHEDHRVRDAARRAIATIEGDDDSMFNLLIAGLSDPNPDVREDSIRGVKWHARESEEVMAALYTMLDDEDVNVKWTACYNLLNQGYGGPMGPDPDKIYGTCVELLNGDPDFSHAYDVAFKLQSMDMELPEAIPGLFILMENTNESHVNVALCALLNVGASYDMIIDRFLQLAHNGNISVVERALPEFWQLGEPKNVPLEQYNLILQDPDKIILHNITREAALDFINRLAPINEDAIPGLIAIMECGNTAVADAAERKLKEIRGN